MNIYTLLASLGGLFVIYSITTAICQTAIARSYHRTLIRITEINNLSEMEISYAGELDRFSPDDGDGFLH